MKAEHMGGGATKFEGRHVGGEDHQVHGKYSRHSKMPVSPVSAHGDKHEIFVNEGVRASTLPTNAKFFAHIK